MVSTEPAAGQSLIFTFRATNAAIASNTNTLRAIEHEQANSQRQLRAYVRISPDGVNPTKIRNALIGHVEIKNVGQIIAQEVSIMIKMEKRKGKNHLNFEISDEGKTANPIGSMLPGVAIRMGNPQEITNEEMPKVGANQNKSVSDREYLYVFGKVTYTDGFETPRMTEFCFRYDTDSRNKEGIAVDTARYQRYANNAT